LAAAHLADDLGGTSSSPPRPILMFQPDRGSTRFLVKPRPASSWWGPQGRCGPDGRKIIVDTYGGTARHGGGAFSARIPPTVDRSSCLCGPAIGQRALVAAGWRRLEVALSYLPRAGQADQHPGAEARTGKLGDEDLTALVQEHFRSAPGASSESFAHGTLPRRARGPFYQMWRPMAISAG